jgi:putative membrane protein
MSPGVKSFLQRWVVTTIGVLLATGVVDGIVANSMVALLAASLLLGILNAVLRPFLLLVALPLLILTLGLFTIIINSLLLYWVGALVKGFYVADFWSAFKGSLLISIVSIVANVTLGKKSVRLETRSVPRPADSPPRQDTGSGPVIDV